MGCFSGFDAAAAILVQQPSHQSICPPPCPCTARDAMHSEFSMARSLSCPFAGSAFIMVLLMSPILTIAFAPPRVNIINNNSICSRNYQCMQRDHPITENSLLPSSELYFNQRFTVVQSAFRVNALFAKRPRGPRTSSPMDEGDEEDDDDDNIGFNADDDNNTEGEDEEGTFSVMPCHQSHNISFLHSLQYR